MQHFTKLVLKLLSACLTIVAMPTWSKAASITAKERTQQNSKIAASNKSSQETTLDSLKAMGLVNEMEQASMDGTQSEGGGITIGR